MSCGVCGSTSQLLRCSRCKKTSYCSKEHQREDWRKHKMACASTNSANGQTMTDKTVMDTGEKPTNDEPFMKLADVEYGALTQCLRRTKFDSDPTQDVEVRRNGNSYSEEYIHVNARLSGKWLPEVSKYVIDDMDKFGLCVVDGFLGDTLGNSILDEVKAMHANGVFEDGQLVNNKVREASGQKIRDDKIRWVDGKEWDCSTIKILIGYMDNIITLCSQGNRNGKLGNYCINGRTKAMVACYPGSGTRYVKHVDNPNKDGRCVTCIYYLNKEWNTELDGGILRIFPDGWTDQVADIEPLFDRLVLFWSDRRNPHEVQPAHRMRYAITVWYFDKEERETAATKKD